MKALNNRIYVKFMQLEIGLFTDQRSSHFKLCIAVKDRLS